MVTEAAELEATAHLESRAGPSVVSGAVKSGFVLVPLVHSAGANLITVLAFRYLTDNLAVSAAMAGALFGFVKIYDGVLDPALGAASDRTRSRYGRRLPYLLLGALLMPAAVVMLFNTPEFAATRGLEIYLALALMLQATAYTALTIPGMAMAVEVSDDYHQRSTLMSLRVFGNSLGVVVGSTLPAWLLALWGATRSGHAQMSWVIAALLLASGLAAVVLLRHTPRTVAVAAPQRLRAVGLIGQVKLAWANKPFRTLASAHIFVLIGTAVMSTSNAYFSKYVLVRTDRWLGTYYLISTVVLVLFMPAWLWLGRRRGKKFCYLLAMAIFGLVHLSWLFAGPGEPYALLVLRVAVGGIASGGLILFAYSMLSDAIRFDYICSGLRREGAFAGLTSLIDKLSAALGLAGFGLILSRMGYAASTTGTLAAQPPSAITAIYLGFAIVPAVTMLFAMLTMLSYRLDEHALHEEHAATA